LSFLRSNATQAFPRIGSGARSRLPALMSLAHQSWSQLIPVATALNARANAPRRAYQLDEPRSSKAEISSSVAAAVSPSLGMRRDRAASPIRHCEPRDQRGEAIHRHLLCPLVDCFVAALLAITVMGALEAI